MNVRDHFWERQRPAGALLPGFQAEGCLPRVSPKSGNRQKNLWQKNAVFRFFCHNFFCRLPEPDVLPAVWQPSPARSRYSLGFTLIEVVISSALMALILVSAYLCLNAGLNSRKLIEPRAEIIQNARVAMALLAADLRAACPLAKDYQFLGTRRLLGGMDADNLDFATHNYTPRRPREGDFCEVSVYLDQDRETGQFSLWRRRNPTIAPDPLSGGRKEEIAKGVVGVRFEYFDGFDWYQSWGEIKPAKRESSQKPQPNLTGLPEAVRITLLLDSNPKAKKSPDADASGAEPPLVFQTVVRLNLAGISTSGAAGSADQPATPGAQPGVAF